MNPGLSAPKADALPDCATPRNNISQGDRFGDDIPVIPNAARYRFTAFCALDPGLQSHGLLQGIQRLCENQLPIPCHASGLRSSREVVLDADKKLSGLAGVVTVSGWTVENIDREDFAQIVSSQSPDSRRKAARSGRCQTALRPETAEFEILNPEDRAAAFGRARLVPK